MDLPTVPVSIYENIYSLTVILAVLYVMYQYWLVVGLLLLCLFGFWTLRKNINSSIEVKGQGILITGCDTGFGFHLAQRLFDTGFTVYAGVLFIDGHGARKLRQRKSKRLQVIQLNVTSDKDVSEAVMYIRSKRTELWGVVSNAGINFPGDVELLTLDQFQKAADVNFYGGLRVIKSFLPLIRKSKGRVVAVSSARGLHSWPGEAAYTITKHSIEAMADSLRLEMRKFHVKVIVVEPGHFDGATSIMSPKQLKRIHGEIEAMWENATEEVKETYGRSYFDHIYKVRADEMKNITSVSPGPVLDAIQEALTSTSPSPRYLVGGTSGFVDKVNLYSRVCNLLPESLTDYLVEAWTGCHCFPPSSTKENTPN